MDAQQKIVSDIDYAIGDRVNTLMRRVGHTRDSFGVVLGVKGSAVSLKLAGKRAWSAQDVLDAANEFGVKVAVLYGDEPMPEPTRPATVTRLNPSRNAELRPMDYKGDSSNVLDMTARLQRVS